MLSENQINYETCFFESGLVFTLQKASYSPLKTEPSVFSPPRRTENESYVMKVGRKKISSGITYDKQEEDGRSIIATNAFFAPQRLKKTFPRRKKDDVYQIKR